jgi:hypothetical protein
MTERLHPDLISKLRLNRLLGAPLMAVIAAVILWSVVYSALKGAEPFAALSLRGIIGALFLWAAAYIWSSGTWYKRASWVLDQGDRVTMKADYAFNSRGGLIVTLSAEGRDGLLILCDPPKWEVNTAEPENVIAHIDPKEGGPVILETPRGIIWPLLRCPARKILTSQPR